jgi:hypothetical protein
MTPTDLNRAFDAELADGRIRGDKDSLSISGSIPWLAGLEARFDFRAVDSVQTNRGPLPVVRTLPVLGPDNDLAAGLDRFGAPAADD